MSRLRVYLSSDAAEVFRAAGLTVRTAAAVRQAVYDGRLSPDMQSERNVHVWSEDALQADLRHLKRLARAKVELRSLVVREVPPEEEQAELFGKEVA